MQQTSLNPLIITGFFHLCLLFSYIPLHYITFAIYSVWRLSLTERRKMRLAQCASGGGDGGGGSGGWLEEQAAAQRSWLEVT